MLTTILTAEERKAGMPFALLTDLLTEGPFAARFVDLHHPEALVDWLGHPAPDQGGASR